MVADRSGKVITLTKNQKLTGSPDGKWMQVRDQHGKPTGLHLDGGHSPFSHSDPRALQPYAHIPNTTNLDGTPWLPLK